MPFDMMGADPFPFGPKIDELRKRKALENPIGTFSGADTIRNMGPSAQQQQAGIMRDINPARQAVQQEMSPMPGGASMGMPPPPPRMPSPIERAKADVPKPGPRGWKGVLGDTITSTLKYANPLYGATGMMREADYRGKLSRTEGEYAREEAYNSQQDAEQMARDRYNLDVRRQGAAEQLGEERIQQATSESERRRAEAEARAEATLAQAQLNERKFQEQIEENKRRNANKDEDQARQQDQFKQSLAVRQQMADIAEGRAGAAGAAQNLAEQRLQLLRDKMMNGEYFTDPNSGQTYKRLPPSKEFPNGQVVGPYTAQPLPGQRGGSPGFQTPPFANAQGGASVFRR